LADQLAVQEAAEGNQLAAQEASRDKQPAVRGVDRRVPPLQRPIVPLSLLKRHPGQFQNDQEHRHRALQPALKYQQHLLQASGKRSKGPCGLLRHQVRPFSILDPKPDLLVPKAKPAKKAN
jgi:hypothetical protein